jgi:hypothetical protein
MPVPNTCTGTRRAAPLLKFLVVNTLLDMSAGNEKYWAWPRGYPHHDLSYGCTKIPLFPTEQPECRNRRVWAQFSTVSHRNETSQIAFISRKCSSSHEAVLHLLSLTKEGLCHAFSHDDSSTVPGVLFATSSDDFSCTSVVSSAAR